MHEYISLTISCVTAVMIFIKIWVNSEKIEKDKLFETREREYEAAEMATFRIMGLGSQLYFSSVQLYQNTKNAWGVGGEKKESSSKPACLWAISSYFAYILYAYHFLSQRKSTTTIITTRENALISK